jgi:hypothetical protein
MDSLPDYVENDTEQSYSYTENGIRTNLSILSAAGDDAPCICHAQYADGQDVPLKDEKLHISSEEKGLLSELLNRSKFI